jgi:hypothetical protein
MDKNGNTTGLVSLILFGVGMTLFGLTAVLTYLPRDNDFRSILTWLGLLVGFSFVFLGIPMLVASFVTSIVSIIKNHKQRIGYMALAGNLLFVAGILLWIFR